MHPIDQAGLQQQARDLEKKEREEAEARRLAQAQQSQIQRAQEALWAQRQNAAGVVVAGMVVNGKLERDGERLAAQLHKMGPATALAHLGPGEALKNMGPAEATAFLPSDNGLGHQAERGIEGNAAESNRLSLGHDNRARAPAMRPA